MWWWWLSGGSGVIYSVNSGTELAGIQADWQRIPNRRNITGETDYSIWANHTWTIPVIKAIYYLELLVLQGTVLTALKTNNINYRNQGTTYTSATMGLVNGTHEGLNMRNVTIEFKVKIS